MEKYMDALRLCPLFKGIDKGDLGAMLDCLDAQPEHFGRGETILAEGDPASRMGILLSGAAQVVRMNYDGSRSLIAMLEPGDLFAEAFACAGVPAMPVSVIAQSTASVLLLEAGKLTRTCGGACSFHHQVLYNLMHILAVKNLVSHQKIEIISRRSTREKLLTYLFLQAKRAGSKSFTIPYDRQALADYLEVDRSGLSAEISKLRKEGVLACDRSRFTLLER